MARKKITVNEKSADGLVELMETRGLSIGEAADLAIRVGCNRLAALGRHKTKKSKEARASKKVSKKKVSKKTSKKRVSKKRTSKKK